MEHFSHHLHPGQRPWTPAHRQPSRPVHQQKLCPAHQQSLTDTHGCFQSGHRSPGIGHHGFKTVLANWRYGSTEQAADPTSTPRSSTHLDNTPMGWSRQAHHQNWHTNAFSHLSNKSSKRKFCAASHAPTTDAFGMIVPLCSYHQPFLGIQ